MDSSGTGSDISMEEATDLLHKLVTESTKVQAIFTCNGCIVNCAIRGILRFLPEQSLWLVGTGSGGSGQTLAFDLSLAVSRRYGDERSLTDRGKTPIGLTFSSALSFRFSDGSSLGLFAITDEE